MDGDPDSDPVTFPPRLARVEVVLLASGGPSPPSHLLHLTHNPEDSRDQTGPEPG